MIFFNRNQHSVHPPPTLVVKLQRSARRELIIGLILVALFITLSILFEIEPVEKFYAFTRDHENWEMDEIFLSLFWFGSGAIIYSLRRMQDIRLLHKAIYKHAFYDTMTHLPNRTLALDRLATQLETAYRSGGGIMVAFIDIDNFKAVNDNYGHHAGDDLIRQVGERLARVVRSNETIARFGGDEFLLIATFATGSDTLTHLTARIRAAHQQPFTINGQQLSVTYSIGVATFPTNGTTAQELIKAADNAMYLAKHKGGGRCEFSTENIHQSG